jgi:hypothetical protein
LGGGVFFAALPLQWMKARALVFAYVQMAFD